MPINIASRNNFPPVLAPGLNHIFLQGRDLRMREAQYSRIFNIADSEDAYEIDYELSGTGPMPEMPEGARPASDGIMQGGTKKYLHLNYGLLSQVTRQLIEDDKYGAIRQIPEFHGRSGLYGREAVCGNVFNLGFSLVTTNDGVSLFHTAHPLIGGTEATNVGPGIGPIINAPGTYPNRPSPDTDLSFTALQQAINLYYRLIDGRGMPVTVRPKYLTIPPELTFMAREILGSGGRPYTNDNEINALQGEGLSYIVLNYLTSPSSWFLLPEKEGHQLKFFERVPFQAQTDDDFQTQVLMFLSTQRFSAGATSWYGVFGSMGP